MQITPWASLTVGRCLGPLVWPNHSSPLPHDSTTVHLGGGGGKFEVRSAAEIGGFSWRPDLREVERGPKAATLEVTATARIKDAAAITTEGGRATGVR